MGTLIPRLKEYEKSLLSEFSQEIHGNKTPIIAIGGFSGTGKDTVALIIQKYFETHHHLSLKLIHAGEFGRLREVVSKDFVRFAIPRRLDIGTGFIMNHIGDVSTQADLVVYDKN